MVSISDEVVFDPITHRYCLGEQEYPSVTRVLREMGLYEPPYGANDGHRERGRLAHEFAQLIDRDVPATWDPEEWEGTHQSLLPYGEAYWRFLADTGFRADVVERPLISAQYRYAGTPDREGMMRGVRKLIDLKTGEPAPGTVFQLALYDRLVTENLQVQVEERLTLQLKPTAKYSLHVVPHNKMQAHLNMALSAVTLWWWRHDNGLLKTRLGGQ